jgi:hypothetical protein
MVLGTLKSMTTHGFDVDGYRNWLILSLNVDCRIKNNSNLALSKGSSREILPRINNFAAVFSCLDELVVSRMGGARNVERGFAAVWAYIVVKHASVTRVCLHGINEATLTSCTNRRL